MTQMANEMVIHAPVLVRQVLYRTIFLYFTGPQQLCQDPYNALLQSLLRTLNTKQEGNEMNLTSVQMAGPQAKQMFAAILSCGGVTVTQQQESRRTPADRAESSPCWTGTSFSGVLSLY